MMLESLAGVAGQLPVFLFAVCLRELDLQHSVLSAQLAAQAAAIKQEREALLNQRINTDMLANLSEQVRSLAQQNNKFHSMPHKVPSAGDILPVAMVRSV